MGITTKVFYQYKDIKISLKIVLTLPTIQIPQNQTRPPNQTKSDQTKPNITINDHN